MDARVVELLTSVVVAAIVGGISGGLWSRSNERQKQLREMMLREVTRLAAGLASAAVELRRLAAIEGGDSERLSCAALGSADATIQRIEDLKRDQIAPSLAAVWFLLDPYTVGKAEGAQVSIDITIGLLRHLQHEPPVNDDDDRLRRFGLYVDKVMEEQYKFRYLAGKNLWSLPGPVRRRLRARIGMARFILEVEEAETNLTELAHETRRLSEAVEEAEAHMTKLARRVEKAVDEALAAPEERP